MATLSISLPTQVAQKIDIETKRHGFATRSEFIRALLRRYFAGELQFEVFTHRPLDEIQEKMERTGKYDKKFIDSVVKGLSKSSLYARKAASS